MKALKEELSHLCIPKVIHKHLSVPIPSTFLLLYCNLTQGGQPSHFSSGSHLFSFTKGFTPTVILSLSPISPIKGIYFNPHDKAKQNMLQNFVLWINIPFQLQFSFSSPLFFSAKLFEIEVTVSIHLFSALSKHCTRLWDTGWKE